MKILIWLVCAFLYGIIVTALAFCGIALGGVPAAIIAGALFLLARHLCARIERKAAAKNFVQDSVSIPEITDPPKKAASHNNENKCCPTVSRGFVIVITIFSVVTFFLVCALCYSLNRNHSLRHDIQELEGQITAFEERSGAQKDVVAVQDGSNNLVAELEKQYAIGKDDGYVDGYIEGYLRGYDEAAAQSKDVEQLDTYEERYLKMRELREELCGHD